MGELTPAGVRAAMLVLAVRAAESGPGRDRLARELGEALAALRADLNAMRLALDAAEEASTIRRILTPLRAALADAVDAGLLPSDPLEHVTFHDLRRAAITRWLVAGVPIKVVQRLAGHADATTTMRHYAKVRPGDVPTGAELALAAR